MRRKDSCLHSIDEISSLRTTMRQIGVTESNSGTDAKKAQSKVTGLERRKLCIVYEYSCISHVKTYSLDCKLYPVSLEPSKSTLDEHYLLYTRTMNFVNVLKLSKHSF